MFPPGEAGYLGIKSMLVNDKARNMAKKISTRHLKEKGDLKVSTAKIKDKNNGCQYRTSLFFDFFSTDQLS